MQKTKAVEIIKPKPQEYFSANNISKNKENIHPNNSEMYRQIALDKLSFKRRMGSPLFKPQRPC